jgi:NitT/TauT family transport system substrate-binding protein
MFTKYIVKKMMLMSVVIYALSASAVNAKDLEKVVASWLPIMQTTAYYVALEEGLFEEAGIEIISTKFGNPNQIIDSLVSGQADFGPPGAAAGIAMLAESRFPGTFKVFGLQGGGIGVDLINDGLIVRKDSGIKSFKDLKGKTLGTVPGIQWQTIARHLVRKNGLDPDKDVLVTAVAVPLQVQSVIAGSVDATLSLEPIGSIADAQAETIRAVVNPCALFISDPFYSGAALLTTKFIRERPEVARKVVEVIDKATAMVNADFDKYKKVIPKYTAIKDSQLDFLAKPYLRPFNDLNETDFDSYQAFVDVFSIEGVLKSPIDIRSKILKMSDFKL